MTTLFYDDVTKLMEYNLLHPFPTKTMNYIFHVYCSIFRAHHSVSKIPTDSPILSYQGMSGIKTRHLYNNLLSLDSPMFYLEIGTWYGSSSISALFNNHNVSATFIDNWSQFQGNKDVLVSALDTYKTPDSSYTLIENDCWKVDVSDFNTKYNIYLYDGPHEESDHYNALVHYFDALSDTFIFIVDDWNWWNVRHGTHRAFSDTNVEICFMHEIFMSPEDLIGFPNHPGKNTWWNGVAIFVLQKKQS
jgi:hypothetical protein